jgi:hypothetical protein
MLWTFGNLPGPNRLNWLNWPNRQKEFGFDKGPQTNCKGNRSLTIETLLVRSLGEMIY